MVAGDCVVVSHGVHNLDQRRALGERSHGTALDSVARVDQGHVARAVQALLRVGIRRDAGIANAGHVAVLINLLVDSAVNVVGKDNGNSAVF